MRWVSFFMLLAGCTPSTPAPQAPAPAAPAASAAPAMALAPPEAPGGPWQSTLDAGHPLVGKLWDTRARAFVDEATLLRRAAEASFVLLGEKHDNADHHRLQARLIEGLARAGKKPAVVLEMIEAGQQAELDAYLASRPGDAAGLGAALRWEKRGWPAWAMYQPVAEAALGAKLKLVGGNLGAAEARSVVKEGIGALGAERTKAWGLETPMEPAMRKELEEEMRASHCGMLPDKVLPGMAEAQRARDAALADRMLASEPAVLIAGAGHARSDRGVPLYLRARKPGARALSVGLREVQRGEQAPGVEPFDVVWYTPRASDDDPCEKMKH